VEAQGTQAFQAIIDLSKMNQILEVNNELCFARLEPGVSQRQMYDYLKTLPGRKLSLDVTGAGNDASIVGNILERGFGHTQYGDRFRHLVSMTVVLPNGSIIKTGLDQWEGSRARSIYRYGIGPMLEGLFSQSNFGIVTEVCIELSPVAEKTECFFLISKKDESLEALIETIRELKLEGTLNSAIHIGNKARVSGANNSIAGNWNMSGMISGPPGIVNERKKRLKKLLKKNIKGSRLFFLDKNKLTFLKWLDRNFFRVPSLSLLEEAMDLLHGIPTDGPIKTLLDNPKMGSDFFASDFPKYLRWISAICPARGSDVRSAVKILQKIFQQHNYEFRVTLTAINPRCFILISNISDDKTEEGKMKLEACYNLCLKELVSAGFYPYRSGSGLYKALPQASPEMRKVIESLKNLFDENEILSPKKYNI